jgi:hypothetical protein
MAHRKAHRKSRKAIRRSQKQSRKAQRKSRRQSRKAQQQRQQGGAQCAAIPLQNAVFAQKGGMADYQVAGNDLLMDKAAMVQAQSFDQLGMIQEAGRVAAAAQHGGRRRSRRHRSRRHRRSQKQQKSRRSSRRERRSRQRGGMSPFDADPMLLPKSAYPFTGVNAQWTTEASVQPALRMGAGPQAA